MFSYLLGGMILACLWRGLLPWLPVFILLWPWTRSLAGTFLQMLKPGRRWQLPVVLVGFLLLFFRLYPPPETAVPTSIQGIWGEETWRRGEIFSGHHLGTPTLRIRALGESSPAPGSRFQAEGICLPTLRSGKKEYRVSAWRSERSESKASLASRLGKPDRRHLLTARLTRDWPGKTRPLARAVLLGDRSTLGFQLRKSFRRAGLAHVLALSGLHVGMFLLLCSRILAMGRLGTAGSEILLLLIILLLPHLFGGGPSITRALVMAFHLLLVRRLGGRPRSLDLLVSAATLEVILSPASLLKPGFQLSYGATLILIAGLRNFTRPPQARWLRFLFELKRGLSVSVACNLATLPVVILCFGRLPLTGPLVNILAGPLLVITLLSGWLALPFSITPLGGMIAWPGGVACSLLQGLAEIAGGPLAVVCEMSAPPLWTWFCWSYGFRRALVAGSPCRPDRLLPMLVPVIVGLWSPFS